MDSNFSSSADALSVALPDRLVFVLIPYGLYRPIHHVFYLLRSRDVSLYPDAEQIHRSFLADQRINRSSAEAASDRASRVILAYWLSFDP